MWRITFKYSSYKTIISIVSIIKIFRLILLTSSRTLKHFQTIPRFQLKSSKKKKKIQMKTKFLNKRFHLPIDHESFINPISKLESTVSKIFFNPRRKRIIHNY